MSRPIVECIPNFSEGRRLEVVEAIVGVIKSVSGVTLLDYSLDADHNRSVVTFVGDPQRVEEAAFRAIAKAAELISLDEHSGEHPRIGATDVVPFVPISGVKMTECVEMAQRVGQRVGEDLGIPVYLYEEAATRPERVNLANIRKGEYEALKEEIGVKATRDPDFGPTKVGKAGATVIGAREPLIAYNVYLNTEDVQIAKKIAKAVRYSSGGLRFVKGLGMLVEGKAQVSMNLTNFRKTPVYRVVEMIRREAARYGVAMESSELIGLIPEEAMVETAAWYLQLDGFDPEQVLERRMRSAQADEGAMPDSSFLGAVASGEPTPGGGSAAAYTGAMAAALVAMVARLTVNKKKYADVQNQMKETLIKAERLRAELTTAVHEDAAAFEQVMAAFKLPKDSDEEKRMRSAAIQAATLHAAEVPLKVAGKVVEVLALAAQVVAQGNTNAISDGATGAALARAALTGSGLNVRINLASLKDEAKAEELSEALKRLEKRADELEQQVQASLVARSGLSG